MKFILYHSTNDKCIKSILKENEMIPYKIPTFSGKEKTEYLYFNLFFKRSFKHPFFKETNFIQNGLLFNEDFLYNLLDKTEIYFNPYWSGYVGKDSIKLTKKNFNEKLKVIKKLIMKSKLPYPMTHEIMIKGKLENIKENLFGIVYHKKEKFPGIKTFGNEIKPNKNFYFNSS